MSIELSKNMYSMEDAVEYGYALKVANGNVGRIRIRPVGGVYIVTLI